MTHSIDAKTRVFMRTWLTKCIRSFQELPPTEIRRQSIAVFQEQMKRYDEPDARPRPQLRLIQGGRP